MESAASYTFARYITNAFGGVRVTVKNKKEPADKRRELLKEIEKVKQNIESESLRFEFLSDPDLVDACIYEMKALNARYHYLTQEARRLGIKSDIGGCLMKM